MSLTAMTFSWRRWRSSLISRSVRRASVRFSKALAIFLIATFSPVAWFLALFCFGCVGESVVVVAWMVG